MAEHTLQKQQDPREVQKKQTIQEEAGMPEVSNIKVAYFDKKYTDQVNKLIEENEVVQNGLKVNDNGIWVLYTEKKEMVPGMTKEGLLRIIATQIGYLQSDKIQADIALRYWTGKELTMHNKSNEKQEEILKTKKKFADEIEFISDDLRRYKEVFNELKDDKIEV